MIARAAGSHASADKLLDRARQCRDELVGRQCLADDAGRGDEHLALRAAEAAAPRRRRWLSTASLPARPVKTLALPEFTTIARTAPPARHSRHHKTGGARGQRSGQDAGDRAAGRQLGQHQIVAPGVADVGGAGGEPHPGIGGSAGKPAGASGDIAALIMFL